MGYGGGRGGSRGRGGGSAGRGGASTSVDGPDDATLIKQRNKIEKQLAEISTLEKQRASGAALDANQLAKVHRRAELQESLRQVYLQGNASQRERLGVCGNCGVRWHATTNCPRPKAVPAPKEVRGRGASVAPDASRDAHQALSSMPKARGAGSGRGSGSVRGRGSGTGRARGGRGGADERHTWESRETRSTGSASTASQSHERRLAKTKTADVGPSEMRATVESLVAMTGADRGVAAAALLSCRGDGNAAAAAILTGQPAPAPAASSATAAGMSADDVVSSMFSFKPPPKPDAQDCDDVSNSGLSHGDQNRGKRGASKVALDRHGLPLAGRGKGSGSNKDRRTVQTGPEQTLVDDFVLIKQRNKIKRQLREITDLQKERRSGLTLQPNQLAKLERQSEVEEMLRQVYLQGTSEQRERLGVCGKCGHSGHCVDDCPRAVALEAKPMPLSASTRDILEKAAEEPAEADAPNDFHYIDPVRLPLPPLL